MAQHRPLRDRRCVFDGVLGAYATLQSLPGRREFGDDLGGTMLETAKLAENPLPPFNGSGDQQNCCYKRQCGAQVRSGLGAHIQPEADDLFARRPLRPRKTAQSGSQLFCPFSAIGFFYPCGRSLSCIQAPLLADMPLT